jgi:phospholipid/cholesterol/gamma-HCH transport system permease protein
MVQTKLFIDITSKRSIAATLEFLDFLGGVVKLIWTVIRSLTKRPFYFPLFVEQCYQLGVKSLSLTLITAISTGMVMSLQFGIGLERFGGKLYVPKIVGLSIMRELGPVLTCLMLAGRVGAGIAAEIGSMKVTQQIDAIRALGTDPIKRVVIPRVLAMLLLAPLLTVLADLTGILSGMFLSYFELNINPEFYFHQAITALRFADFTLGFLKTPFFGLIIAITGCHFGLTTTGGTQGVGRATTKAVVTSSILITVSDFMLTKLFMLFERGIGV